MSFSLNPTSNPCFEFRLADTLAGGVSCVDIGERLLRCGDAEAFMVALDHGLIGPVAWTGCYFALIAVGLDRFPLAPRRWLGGLVLR